MRKITMVLVAAIMLAGCASYRAKGLVPQDYKDDILTAMVEKEGVRVTAFFIIRKADAKKYFDENIVNEGILALWVNIDNEGEYPVRFASADLKVGEEIVAPMNTYEVYKAVKKGVAGMVGRAYLWGLPALALTGVGVVGVIPSVIHTNSVNSDIEKDVREKALLPGEIKPRGAAQGFIWFKMPEKVIVMPEAEGADKHFADLKGITLSIEVVKKGKSLECNLPLS